MPAIPLGAVVVAGAVALAVWLRLATLLHDFPTGDGGLFWVMANELNANGFVPPDTTAYNDAGIPWVYPPLGLYLLALLGADLVWLEVLPVLFAVATLPAMWLLARSLIGDRGAVVATIAYGLSAPAYVGLVAGGGVTRGPGVLFAMLTLWAVVCGHPVRAGVLGGLVILCHPIAAFYAGLSAAALWLARGADRRMLVAPVISVAIGAAWFVPMIIRHGVEPFVSGVGSRQIDIVENLVTIAAQALNPPNLAFTIGAVGVVVAAGRRRWDLLAWFALSAVGAAVVDRWVVIPLAVLAGLTVDVAIDLLPRKRSVAVLATASVVAVLGVLLATPPASLSDDERAIASWAATETPDTAEFAVIGYSFDAGMVDWFPALSGRHNVTTWQGTEWLPTGSTRGPATEIADCREVACLPAVDYYVLRDGCCTDMSSELDAVRPWVFESRADR